MDIWKIKNTSSNKVKVAVAAKNTLTKGVILEPGQFCIAEGRMTRSLDAQEKRGFVSVERSFNNDKNLNLAEAYNMSEIDIAQEKAEGYSK